MLRRRTGPPGVRGVCGGFVLRVRRRRERLRLCSSQCCQNSESATSGEVCLSSSCFASLHVEQRDCGDHCCADVQGSYVCIVPTAGYTCL